MAISNINDQDVFKKYITPGEFIYPDDIIAKLRARKINPNDIIKDYDLFGFTEATSTYIILGLLNYFSTYHFTPSNIVLDIFDKNDGKHSFITFDYLKNLQNYFDNRTDVAKLSKPSNLFKTIYYIANVNLTYKEKDFECFYSIRNVDNDHHIEVNYKYNKKNKDSQLIKSKIEKQIKFIKETYNDYLDLYDTLYELYIQELYYVAVYGEGNYVVENNNYTEFMKLFDFNNVFPYKNLNLYRNE